MLLERYAGGAGTVIRIRQRRARPRVRLPQRVIDGHQETLEGGAVSAAMILNAGGRIGLGGDYGFAWNPHGDYAKELTLLRQLCRLHAARGHSLGHSAGAEIMGRADEFGTVAPGKLADLLVVDGDPIEDIRVLEDRADSSR